jgi:alpha/beta superfamily hydrolase
MKATESSPIRAVPDLLIITASATEAARGEFEGSLDEAAAWVEWLQAGAPSAAGCVICGSLGPTEAHHVAGRRHSDLTVPACVPCHRRLTERQYGWDPRWLSETRSPELDRSLIVRGLSDLCEERGRFETAHHVLAKRLRAQYATLARKTISGAAS